MSGEVHVEFLVEERSMEEALHGFLPQLLGGPMFKVYSFQGKRDLLDKLPARLRGYSKWMPPEHYIVVLLDRDADDCVELKDRLEKVAEKEGLTTKTAARGPGFRVINRIVVEELEAWYFGDWEAVRAAYPRVDANVANKAKYRDPDKIIGAAEAFERVLQRAGYFKGGLPKIAAAGAVAEYMRPDRNRSRSFQVFRQALEGLIAR